MANVLNFIKKTLIASIKFAFIITLVFSSIIIILPNFAGGWEEVNLTSIWAARFLSSVFLGTFMISVILILFVEISVRISKNRSK